jgi:hypothetical protein
MTTRTAQKKACHDCRAIPGAFHSPGCDTERCPYCGFQLISCPCLEDKRKRAWIEKNLLPWTGTWPGAEEAIEFGLYCRWEPNERFEAEAKRIGRVRALRTLSGPLGRWVVCGKDDPEARPDLNRMVETSVWDRKKKRFVKKP